MRQPRSLVSAFHPFSERMMSAKPPVMTTAAGIPVADNENSLTAGPRRPAVMERMAHFTRERVPERVVHAKGAGAYGVFTVTQDITAYTRARLFEEVGK